MPSQDFGAVSGGPTGGPDWSGRCLRFDARISRTKPGQWVPVGLGWLPYRKDPVQVEGPPGGVASDPSPSQGHVGSRAAPR